MALDGDLLGFKLDQSLEEPNVTGFSGHGTTGTEALVAKAAMRVETAMVLEVLSGAESLPSDDKPIFASLGGTSGAGGGGTTGAEALAAKAATRFERETILSVSPSSSCFYHSTSNVYSHPWAEALAGRRSCQLKP
jgi:hypothetical protein